MKKHAQFRVDPRLTSLLGEGYRSTEQALKELIDNAWDADAEHVWITLPKPMTNDPIIVKDDGTGMTGREVLSEYLNIASDRRSRKGEKTLLKQRSVKGRKGIGKFAGLVAADVMDVSAYQTDRRIVAVAQKTAAGRRNLQFTFLILTQIVLPAFSFFFRRSRFLVGGRRWAPNQLVVDATAETLPPCQNPQFQPPAFCW